MNKIDTEMIQDILEDTNEIHKILNKLKIVVIEDYKGSHDTQSHKPYHVRFESLTSKINMINEAITKLSFDVQDLRYELTKNSLGSYCVSSRNDINDYCEYVEKVNKWHREIYPYLVSHFFIKESSEESKTSQSTE
jgi:hypothetical protein